MQIIYFNEKTKLGGLKSRYIVSLVSSHLRVYLRVLYFGGWTHRRTGKNQLTVTIITQRFQEAYRWRAHMVL